MASTLDWEEVKRKYPPGSKVKQLVTKCHDPRTVREMTILGVEEDCIRFKWGVVKNGKVSRCNLERMTELVSDGVIKQNTATLVNDYRTIISDERPTTACAILVDLGLITLEDIDDDDAEPVITPCR